MVEPLVLGILLSVVAIGTAITMMAVNRVSGSANQVDDTASAIEADLTSIRQLSRRYTCCSGTCTTSIPTAYGGTNSCAVNDPESSSYFFPLMDNPGTVQVEPDVVDAICSPANNTAFLTPLKTAIDAVAVPTGVQRTTQIEPNRLLKVTYVTTADSRKVRVFLLSPPMASWCP